jgi:hypothetical protein
MLEIDVVQLFAVKLFEKISLCEMKRRCIWWNNGTTLLIHQFPTVNSVITPPLHTARTLLSNFYYIIWQQRFSHYKYRRSVLLKHFKVSSNWTATQWPYLVGVTGNICVGPTNNASIWPRLGFVERNAWSINKHFHHQLHTLHIAYNT